MAVNNKSALSNTHHQLYTTARRRLFRAAHHTIKHASAICDNFYNNKPDLDIRFELTDSINRNAGKEQYDNEQRCFLRLQPSSSTDSLVRPCNKRRGARTKPASPFTQEEYNNTSAHERLLDAGEIASHSTQPHKQNEFNRINENHASAGSGQPRLSAFANCSRKFASLSNNNHEPSMVHRHRRRSAHNKSAACQASVFAVFLFVLLFLPSLLSIILQIVVTSPKSIAISGAAPVRTIVSSLYNSVSTLNKQNTPFLYASAEPTAYAAFQQQPTNFDFHTFVSVIPADRDGNGGGQYYSYDFGSPRTRRHFPQRNYGEAAEEASSSSEDLILRRLRSPLETTASGGGSTVLSSSASSVSGGRLEGWTDAILNYTKTLSCDELPIASRDNCDLFKSTSASAFNVYVAVANEKPSDTPTTGDTSVTAVAAGRRLITVLPERNGQLRSVSGGAAAHDVVLIIDPFTEASFGHALLVFFVDLAVEELDCVNTLRGLYLGQGECLQLARKARCGRIVRTMRERQLIRHCEIDFLPLVHDKADLRQRRQLLQCRNLRGFKTCPVLASSVTTSVVGSSESGVTEQQTIFRRAAANFNGQQIYQSVNVLSPVPCEPGDANQYRCLNRMSSSSSSASMYLPQPNCRIYQVCDHAVIISGGWNSLTATERYLNNAREINSLLHRNGFRQENIKTFFANGRENVLIPSSNATTFHSATLKSQMRSYIHGLCDDRRHLHCVDSFVIYLNAPANVDRKILLWDTNNNGRLEASEHYSANELLNDLSYCAANQVFVVVDQSYAGQWLKAVANENRDRRGALDNVQIVASAGDHMYSLDNTFTQQFLYQNFNRDSVLKIFQNLKSNPTLARSHCAYHDCSDGRIQRTLFGSPAADSTSASDDASGRRDVDSYKGCYNVPPIEYSVRLDEFDRRRYSYNNNEPSGLQQSAHSDDGTDDPLGAAVAAAAGFGEDDE